MKLKVKILCFSFSFLLLFFGSFTHVLAYTVNSSASTFNAEIADLADFNNFLVANSFDVIAPEEEATLAFSFTLSTCSTNEWIFDQCAYPFQFANDHNEGDGSPIWPFSASATYTYEELIADWNIYFPVDPYPDGEPIYLFIRGAWPGAPDPNGEVTLASYIVSSSTATTTGATGVLDTISTAIVNTVVEFSSIIITNFWPFVLVFAILAGFGTAIMLFFKKITS